MTMSLGTVAITIDPGTILNMRASLSYWRELIGPPIQASMPRNWAGPHRL